MAKMGISPKTLQYLMGHADISVTLNVYTHLGLEDAKAELERLLEAKKEEIQLAKDRRKDFIERVMKDENI
jgi:integrase